MPNHRPASFSVSLLNGHQCIVHWIDSFLSPKVSCAGSSGSWSLTSRLWWLLGSILWEEIDKDEWWNYSKCPFYLFFTIREKLISPSSTSSDWNNTEASFTILTKFPAHNNPTKDFLGWKNKIVYRNIFVCWDITTTTTTFLSFFEEMGRIDKRFRINNNLISCKRRCQIAVFCRIFWKIVPYNFTKTVSIT